MKLHLFLGFPAPSSYQADLKKIKESLVASFIGPTSDCLNSIDKEGVFYIGKPLGKECSSEDLLLAEAHIYSVLKKLIPHYPYASVPLALIPISHE